MDNETRWGSAFAVVDAYVATSIPRESKTRRDGGAQFQQAVYHSEGRSPPRLVVHFESEDLQIECGLLGGEHPCGLGGATKEPGYLLGLLY